MEEVNRVADLTLAGFVSRFGKILTQVREADPGGADPSLRLTVSFALYACFDTLRTQERPFDRLAFAERVDAVEQMLREYPRGARSVSPERGRPGTEEFVAELYSRCWAKYDDASFLDTVDLFQERFHLNEIDISFLKGAGALDAGCGSGRYTLAMARLGAKTSLGIDISVRAIHEARERIARLGFSDSVRFVQGSVVDMPWEWTGAFDFVCSNGVVHHTIDPPRGLHEIFRVLKPGGTAFVFVYGGGGLFWELVDVVRALVAPVSLQFADGWLQTLGVPPGKIFNYLDHWYTPVQERLTKHEFEARLTGVGFERLRYMPRAKIYDASERLYRFRQDGDLVGEGDLRYLVEKRG